MAYPGEIYVPRPRENWPRVVYGYNKKTAWFKEDADAIENEIIAIETELGLEPKGSDLDVAARLNRMEGEVKFPTSAPPEPVAGKAWFEVATNKLWIFNGTTWVSSQFI